MAVPLRARACAALALAAAVLCACTQRPAPTPQEQPPTAPAPQKPRSPTAPIPPATVSPEPPASAPKLSDAERGPLVFEAWRRKHEAEVEAFETFLVHERLAHVVPTYQLLRSASMWKECHAEPFELPPRKDWVRVRDLLVLLYELKQQGVLGDFEVVSAYRDPRLNRCAGGAPGSSHQLFAVDIAPLARAEGDRLCRFWHQQGPRWQMGVSRYPSGRIHIDRNGYRTWGASHRRASSYCLG